MQEWFEAGACDGFNITPATLPGGGEDFVDMVVPELQRRALFRTEYEGGTLREESRFAPGDQSLQPGSPGRGVTHAPPVEPDPETEFPERAAAPGNRRDFRYTTAP